jgi:hypothetical protein
MVSYHIIMNDFDLSISIINDRKKSII